jgi:hypothetical protein
MTEKDIIVNCPHCNNSVFIEKINCGIFRHGVWKKNRKQIDPHCPKKLCDFYLHLLTFYTAEYFKAHALKSSSAVATHILKISMARSAILNRLRAVASPLRGD